MSWQWFAMLGAVALAALLFRRHVGFVTRIDGQSMQPTLRPGQLLFTRTVRHGRAIHHGDIAVVQSTELSQRVVKRVLGLPGDRLVLGPYGLVRNDEPISEPYLVHAGGRGGSWLVPEAHCFLLGDNRAVSSDSRSWQQSFAPLETIVGRVYTWRLRSNVRLAARSAQEDRRRARSNAINCGVDPSAGCDREEISQNER